MLIRSQCAQEPLFCGKEGLHVEFMAEFVSAIANILVRLWTMATGPDISQTHIMIVVLDSGADPLERAGPSKICL